MSIQIHTKDTGTTYQARAPGHKEKASCTAGAEQAAHVCAAKILGGDFNLTQDLFEPHIYHASIPEEAE